MKHHTTVLLTVICLISTSASFAQSEAPAVPKILNRVLSLEGTWEAEATMQMGGNSDSFPYSLRFWKMADGNGLYMDETATIPEVGTLVGGNIIGFDPHEQKLHWFSVDNFGTSHDHVGELLGKDHLRLIHESQREGKVFREEIDLIWKTPKEIHVRLVGTLDGQTEETLEGTFVRKSQK